MEFQTILQWAMGIAYTAITALGAVILKMYNTQINEVKEKTSFIEMNYAHKNDLKSVKEDQNKLIYMLIEKVDNLQNYLHQINKK